MKEFHLQGIAASAGIAIGPAYCHTLPDLTIPCRERGPVEEEMARFAAAVNRSRGELQEMKVQLEKSSGAEVAAIFDAHQMILDDPMLAGKVRAAVECGQVVEQAVVSAIDELAAMLASMDDELFSARAADVRDIGRRVLCHLLGQVETPLSSIRTPSIVVADDLTPSDTASLDRNMVLGFCTAAGGLTSHSAILARTFGIPAVVALGEGLLGLLQTGTPLVLDGGEGKLIAFPEPTTATRYGQARQDREHLLAEVKSSAAAPARMADGRRVEVAANIGEVTSAREALDNGAEGVGLLRTEFLYLDEAQPPSEEKQIRVYREIFEVMGLRPVIVRTLDIGGDKPPSFLSFAPEMNPFMGWRAIRISLDRPQLFKTQLRAILRAADGYQARIMFPMISGLEELRRARAVVEEVKAELTAENLTLAREVPVGIMVETPAAAVLVDVLAEAADFFSLGTNDLTQYTLAVDRGNAVVSSLYQPLHPAVLRLIRETIDLAHAKGKWVGMCGELAGMQKAIPILLGLGLDEFSMNPRAIPEAKHLIGKLDASAAGRVAGQAMSAGTAVEIETLMKDFLSNMTL